MAGGYGDMYSPGFFDLGGAMNQLGAGYDDAIKLKIAQQDAANRQQQTQYEYPQTVDVPAKFVNQALQNQDLIYGTSLENSSRIQSQYQRGNVFQDPRTGKWMQAIPDQNGRVQLVPALPVNAPIKTSEQEQPQGQMQASAPQAEPSRDVAGSEDQQAPQQKILSHPELMDKFAKSYGGEYHPDTDTIRLPGRVGMALMEKIQPQISGNIADIYKSARPMQAPYINPAPPPHQPGRGSTKDPLDERIKSNDKRMNDILGTQSGIGGKVGGPDKIKNPALKAEYFNLQKENERLRDLQNKGASKLFEPQESKTAPKQQVDPVSKIKASPNFKALVGQYKEAHKGVTDEQAEQAIIAIGLKRMGQ